MRIPIFFSSDDNYIPYVSTMMQSIMENADDKRFYEFYILHRNIKNDTMDKLNRQISLFPAFTLNFVDMSPYLNDFNFFVDRHVTVETYFRLLIPYIFPDMEKVIYLDGDMICLTDISLLFDYDISDYLLAGCQDMSLSWFYSPEKNKSGVFDLILSIDNPQNYVNAGMLIINTKKFAEKYSLKYIVETVNSRKWKMHDQDILNVLAKDNILLIDKSWNYTPDKYAKYLPEKYLSEYNQAKENPKIIHYICYKPDTMWWYVPHFEEFWKYATRTPFVKEFVARTNKSGIVDLGELEDKIAKVIKERSGFGGRAILKAIAAFFTRKPLENKTLHTS